MVAVVIRPLAHSEEIFAAAHAYTGHSVRVHGRLDIGALAAAFDAVVHSHPVLGARLERDTHGRHTLVTSAARPRLSVTEGDPDQLLTGAILDQARALGTVCVVRERARASVTLLTNHCIADGTHTVTIFADLWSYYTDIVEGRAIQPREAGFPLPAEELLVARGIEKLPLDQADPDQTQVPPPMPEPDPQPVDDAGFLLLHTTRIRLTRDQTGALSALARDANVTVNGLVSAAILLAESRFRGLTMSELIFTCAVDLRTRVSPAVGPTEGTNMVGSAVYTPTDASPTDLVELARDINASVRDQIADGIPQQMPLHIADMSAGAVVVPTQLIVGATNLGRVPHLPTPADLTLDDFRITMAGKPLAIGSPRASSASCNISIFDERLSIEVHHAESACTAERRRMDLIQAGLLAAIAG
ncbi:hypothetical protein AB0H76_33380 [Nocardia sp. NPDC050712]|uniref:phthiocerol/phthiodiolone dimycocerosyl transferase family protein n=1 Tax=Nocardia sp. NPDC050712 TaxID=3155518 RepID=UPI0033E1FC9A